MAKAEFKVPTNYISNPETGKPVSLGSVYFGVAGLDPFILANRVTVFLVQEDGNEVEISASGQPLQTVAGSIIYQGSPVTVLIDGVYSLRVNDSVGAQVYYAPRKNEVADVSTETGIIPANGSFELETQTSGEPDSWSLQPSISGQIGTDTDSAHGLKSLKFTSINTSGAGTARSDKFDVLESSNVNVFFVYKSSAADTRNKVDINWFDSSNSLISTSSIMDESAANPTSFSIRSVGSTSPANAVRADILITGLDGVGATTSGTTHFDRFDIDVLGASTSISGTFVPVMGSGTGWTYSTQLGFWTLSGKTLTISYSVTTTNIGAGATGLLSVITGLSGLLGSASNALDAGTLINLANNSLIHTAGYTEYVTKTNAGNINVLEVIETGDSGLRQMVYTDLVARVGIQGSLTIQLL